MDPSLELALASTNVYSQSPINTAEFRSEQQPRAALPSDIEFYDAHRLQSARSFRSPIQFKQQSL